MSFSHVGSGDGMDKQIVGLLINQIYKKTPENCLNISPQFCYAMLPIITNALCYDTERNVVISGLAYCETFQ